MHAGAANPRRPCARSLSVGWEREDGALPTATAGGGVGRGKEGWGGGEVLWERLQLNGLVREVSSGSSRAVIVGLQGKTWFGWK